MEGARACLEGVGVGLREKVAQGFCQIKVSRFGAERSRVPPRVARRQGFAADRFSRSLRPYLVLLARCSVNFVPRRCLYTAGLPEMGTATMWSLISLAVLPYGSLPH
jgi:hypothetical protein